MTRSAALVALAISIVSLSSQASTVILEPSADTVLLSSDSLANQGGISTLSLSPQADTERSLAKFDLSNLTLDPSNLQSATLELTIDYKSADWSNSGNATEIALYRLLADWDESGASWICSTVSCATNWNGGSYTPSSPTDTINIADISSGTIQFDVTADLLDMLSGGNEFGWLLKKSREDKSGSIIFSSREGGNTPRLILTVSGSAPDIAPPIVEITAPSSTLVISATVPTIAANFSDDQGISTTNIYLDGDPIDGDCATTSTSTNCSLSELDEGVHLLEIFADDTAGKSGSDSLEFLYLKGLSTSTGFASQWHANAGVPADSLGENTDLYLDTSTANVYQKQSGIWNLLLNIKGAKGDKGDTGLAGTTGAKGEKGNTGPIGATGAKGENGDPGDSILADLNCTTDQLIKHNGTEWLCVELSDISPLAGLSCTEGDYTQYIGGAWICSSSAPSGDGSGDSGGDGSGGDALGAGTTCATILADNPSAISGMYTVDLDDTGPLSPFDAYCEMSIQGGGWMLYANHRDNINPQEVNTVTTSDYGVMQADRWRAARDSMGNGMLFIDENNKVSRISIDKLNSANCLVTSSVERITDWRFLWHNENAGCNYTGVDYSFINLAKIGQGTWVTNAASLYQRSTVKFDLWPYSDPGASAAEQNELLYFIK